MTTINKDEKMLKDCKDIAMEYCKRINAEYIYADLYSFGYETQNGVLVKKYWYELYEELKEKENDK